MITNQLPHNARYIPTSSVFTATFNTPTLGKYDFNSSGNQNTVILPNLDTNSIYIIADMQVGGNIPQEEYLAAINTTPFIRLKTKVTKEIVYASVIPVVLYSQSKDITAYVHSDKGGDQLVADMQGILNQTSYLLGLPSVSISITFSIFAMDSRDYNEYFRGVSQDTLYKPVRRK